MRPMRVLLVASEAVPYSKTGGLADVVGALAVALRRKGVDAALMIPWHRTTRTVEAGRVVGEEFRIRVGFQDVTGRVRRAEGREGLPVYFIQQDRFFDRAGLYGDARGDYPDNAARFVFFSRAVLETARMLRLAPDMIHCHDWQTGLIPLYLKSLYREMFPEVPSVYTIHNLGYQGVFWHYDMPLLGLGWEYFNINALEYYGKINFMKAGLVFSDHITVVSPTYAREIQTPEGGFGLDGVLRNRSDQITGLLNGLDTEEWNPATDPYVKATFSPGHLKGRSRCRADLRRETGLKMRRDLPLLSVVARLSEQKGINDVIRAVEMFAGTQRAQAVILGAGDTDTEERVAGLAARYPGYVHVRIGFDEAFAHRIYAGSDIFLMPSRYEPCGLGQMIAMRYGAIPVVRKTGGLADTVHEKGTNPNGYVFTGSAPISFVRAVGRAIEGFSEASDWAFRMNNGMTANYSWDSRADDYVRLYARLAIPGGRGLTP